MFGKILFIVGIVAASLLLIVLTITTPATAGAFGILAVFLLGYIVTTVILTFVLWSIAKLTRKFMSEMKLRTLSWTLTMRKAYYYASVVALAPVILVSLQSIGGAGIYEVLLVGFFVALGCVYVAKRTG